MIYSILVSLGRGASLRDVLPGILFTIIVVLFSLSFHEMSHAFIAYKLGDPTARNLGRITLNPKKHLDPMGTVCMMLFGFGWAKPVPINTRNFKKPRSGLALSSRAGPVSNLILAFVSMLLWALVLVFLPVPAGINAATTFGGKLLFFLKELLMYFHVLNLYLAVFNLLPIPPLDGSNILFMFLPSKALYFIQQHEPTIRIVLFVLLFMGALSGIIGTISTLISNGMLWIITLIPGI